MNITQESQIAGLLINEAIEPKLALIVMPEGNALECVASMIKNGWTVYDPETQMFMNVAMPKDDWEDWSFNEAPPALVDALTASLTKLVMGGVQ
jgi:hypothetical protein